MLGLLGERLLKLSESLNERFIVCVSQNQIHFPSGPDINFFSWLDLSDVQN